MPAPVLLQGFGHLGDFLGDDVPPYSPVLLSHACGNGGAVGVNGVARVDEEIGLRSVHGFVAPHAAEFLVDAPALTGGVAGPHEGLPVRRRTAASARVFSAVVVLSVGGTRRCAEGATHCLAWTILILEGQFQRETCACGKALGMDFGGEVAGVRGQRSADGPAETVASAKDLTGASTA